MQIPLRLLAPLALASLAQAFPQAAPDITPPQVLAGPTLRDNPVRFVPNSAIIDLVTDEPTKVSLGFYDGFRSWRVIADNQLLTNHSVPVVGMRPNRVHSIRVSVFDAAGNLTVVPGDLSFTTPPLPPGFPPMEVQVHDQAALEGGLTLFAAAYSTPGGGPSGSWVIILDKEFEVVWYYRNPALLVTNIERLRNGNFLFPASREAWEIDVLGRVRTVWHASNLGGGAPPNAVPLALDTIHHELTELPAIETADFLTLSSELRVLPNYPASEIDPTMTNPTAQVIGDVIAEFQRDGTIVRQVSLHDVLDPYRIVYDSLGTNFYNGTYPGPTHDWSHANSVQVDPGDDSWIVSCRHQEAVVKIRRSDHSIVWILGPHDRWGPAFQPFLLTPVGGPFEWNYHQHAPKLNALGNLVMFDNGNRRVIPPAVAPPPQQWYSRAVEFRIDPLAMTVRQIWAYGGAFEPLQNQFFSAFLCESQPLAGGNLLVTDGTGPNFVTGVNRARIAEVARTRPARPLAEIKIEDHTAALNWTVYRSERLPSLYQ